MSSFNLPPRSVGPSANPLTARAGTSNVAMGGGVGPAVVKTKTLEEQIAESASRLATLPHGSPSYVQEEARLNGLLQTRDRVRGTTPLTTATAPTQAHFVDALKGMRASQEAGAPSGLAAQQAGIATSLSLLRQKEVDRMLDEQRRQGIAERAARNAETAAKLDSDRKAIWSKRFRATTGRDPTPEDYQNYKAAAFHETISAPQPGALDARRAVQSQDIAAADAAARKAHAFSLQPGSYAGPTATSLALGQVPGAAGVRPTQEVNQADVITGNVSDVMRQAQARSGEMASPSYSHAANQMSHIKQMMNLQGMDPARQDEIINRVRNGEITLDDAMGFLQSGNSLDQYRSEQEAAMRNLGLTTLHPGLMRGF